MTESIGTPTALVIEDERDILELLTSNLQRLGYAVSKAETGERGVALAFAEPPDLVLVDVMLPGIDGREVVRRLRDDVRTRRCPIVVCSVLERTDIGDVDADAVLSKPFVRSTLNKVVRDVTNREGP